MGAAPPLGAAMSASSLSCFRVFVAVFVAVCVLAIASVPPAAAGDRYALIVTGASGGPQYAQKYETWRASLITTLRDRFAYPLDHIVVLAEDQAPGIRRATRENVRVSLGELRRRVSKDDVVLVLLLGHGTALDGDDGKFNLVGPDLSGEEWASLVKPIAGRLVFVNTTGGSFPFLHKIAGPGRIVLTSTQSAAQQFDTVFPEFFVKAFEDQAADTDKNQKVSVWEAFAYASGRVRTWFDERGQLATEGPLLDDTGRGIGREAGTEGPDGALARTTYLQPEVLIPATADAELAGLLRRRGELESAIERLRTSKPTMPADQYEAELEKLLLELTRIDRQIRSRS
jgi:hypothetical protein